MLLALGLSALVIVITQWLFPTPRPKHPAGADSTSVAASGTAPSAASSTTVGSTAAGTAPTGHAPGVGVPPPGARGATVAGTPSAAAVLAETLTVSTAHAVYRFVNIGATPVSVTMRDYAARAPGKSGQSTIEQPGEGPVATGPLLRYRAIIGRDTLPLDRTPFQGTVSRAPDGSPLVTFRGTVHGSAGDVLVTITYALAADGYLSHVQGTIGAGGGGPGYLVMDLPSGLASFEADTADDQRHLAYVVKPARGDAASVPFTKLEPGEQKIESGPITWAAAKSKYFLVGVLTPTQAKAPPGADTVGHGFAEVDMVGGVRSGKVAVRANATVVAPLVPADGGQAFAFDLYTGPQEWRRLRAIGRGFEEVNPYGGFLHPVLQPFATFAMESILWMRTHLKVSYGWVLIIFGVVIRLALWPLNQRAMRSSLKMQAIQPELAAVQKRYQNDHAKLQAEMMRVYREHGMSPFSPIAGCLPMLLPMPIFFALLFVFQNTIEFRGVPFLWLHDISVKDPYYILPLVMGASSFLLSWIGLRNSPPNPQAKMMAYVFPVMMTVLLSSVAAGLNLYYAVQNIAALPQQWLLARARKKTS